MNSSAKKTLFLILFLFLIGCKAESPTTGSSDNSSSTDTSTGDTSTGDSGTGDSGTGTTSYVGKWVKSDDNTIAMDWKSDSFIYSCLVGTYTYAAHGSYSSSNARLTWWDGTYNTVTSSGSNIIVGSATYIPAVLYAACNPFWTYHTSENTSYTNLAKSIGYWSFTFTISTTTFTDYPLLRHISTRRSSDNNYYNYGTDVVGNIIIGTYTTSNGFHDILDDSGTIISKYFVFTMNSSNSGITSGCYYQYSKSSQTWSNCFSLSGTKIYGTPRTYRIVNENSSDEMMEKRVEEQIIKESMRGKRRLSDKDLNAFKRYKKLLQILKSTEKEPLKRYLQSFRTN